MEIMIVILVIVAIYVLSGIKVVNQYQRGVVLTLGKFTGVREPGLRVVVPIFQTMMMVDVRSTPIDVPKQEVITKDNVTVGVDAVVYFRVINAPKAVLENDQLYFMPPANLPRLPCATSPVMSIWTISWPSVRRFHSRLKKLSMPRPTNGVSMSRMSRFRTSNFRVI